MHRYDTVSCFSPPLQKPSDITLLNHCKLCREIPPVCSFTNETSVALCFQKHAHTVFKALQWCRNVMTVTNSAFTFKTQLALSDGGSCGKCANSSMCSVHVLAEADGCVRHQHDWWQKGWTKWERDCIFTETLRVGALNKNVLSKAQFPQSKLEKQKHNLVKIRADSEASLNHTLNLSYSKARETHFKGFISTKQNI